MQNTEDINKKRHIAGARQSLAMCPNSRLKNLIFLLYRICK